MELQSAKLAAAGMNPSGRRAAAASWSSGRRAGSDKLPATEIEALETCLAQRPALARRHAQLHRPRQVLRLRGTLKIEHTIADQMSRKLWRLLQTEPYVPALGALTGNQAVQMAQAGLKAIYLSGWQVAADANLAATMYPDQSLYPSNSVPMVVRRINKALQRADQIQLLRDESRSTSGRRSSPTPKPASAARSMPTSSCCR